MHKGIKHTKVMEGYSDFARSEGDEAKKYMDSIIKNDPFAEGVDDMSVRKRLLEEYNIEIGGGLGPFAGKIWRIGLMGESSTKNHINMLLAALKEVM